MEQMTLDEQHEYSEALAEASDAHHEYKEQAAEVKRMLKRLKTAKARRCLLYDFWTDSKKVVRKYERRFAKRKTVAKKKHEAKQDFIAITDGPQCVDTVLPLQR